jgi:hypothetical protein
MSSFFRVNEPAAAMQVMDGEADLIHFESGKYYAANRTGSYLLDMLSRGHNLEELCEHLPPAARSDVYKFVDLLATEGLLHATTVPPSLDLSSEPWPDDSAPALETHTDLEDLLKLDPIHDVQADGWPRRAEP